MWWLWSAGVPRRESMGQPLRGIQQVQGAQRLHPLQQIRIAPQLREPNVEQIGGTGQPSSAGSYETRQAGGAPTSAQAAGPARSANPLLNFGLSIGLRAVGLGIVAPLITGILNAIIGPSKRAVDVTTTGDPTHTNFAPSDFGDLLRQGDPWAQATAIARAESAARGVRMDSLLTEMERQGQNLDIQAPVDVETGDQDIELPGPIAIEEGPYTPEGVEWGREQA